MRKCEKTAGIPSDTGKLVVGDDGVQYFVLGKNLIIVSEHFSDAGATLQKLIEEVIIYVADTMGSDN